MFIRIKVDRKQRVVRRFMRKFFAKASRNSVHFQLDWKLVWPDRKVELQRVAAGGVAGRTSGESEHFNEGPGFGKGLGGSLSIISPTLGNNYPYQCPRLDSCGFRSIAFSLCKVQFGGVFLPTRLSPSRPGPGICRAQR